MIHTLTRTSGRAILLGLALALGGGVGFAADTTVAPPASYGPVPSERQLRWHEMEFYGFLHFTVNTFTDKEWGNGDERRESLSTRPLSTPTRLFATAKEAGMKGLILTAKHHDGFCLWPSQLDGALGQEQPLERAARATWSRRSPRPAGARGSKFGVYLSPWDRNHKDYARPEYVAYYRNQLRELLTNYGDIFTVWFDGANGGDGYYGGARETRQIDNRTLLRLGEHLADRPRADAGSGHVQRRRAGLPLGGQRDGHRRRSVLGDVEHEQARPLSRRLQ